MSTNLFWDLMSALAPRPPQLTLHTELSHLIRQQQYAEAYVLALFAERVPGPAEVASMDPTLRALRQKMGLPVPLSPTQIVAQADGWSRAIEAAVGWHGAQPPPDTTPVPAADPEPERSWRDE